VPHRSRLVLSSLVALALACNRTPPEPPATMSATTMNPEPAQASAHGEGASHGPAATTGSSTPPSTAPNVEVPPGAPPTSLQIQDIVVGTGPEAHAGQRVEVQYTGVSFSTHRQFDSSWSRGAQPFGFVLGQGQVIPGWDRGVAGMHVGGRRRLVIPPDLAYGPRGAGRDIGPNETLVFVVDLVSVR
jgi:peptidylprolyl isomerase